MSDDKQRIGPSITLLEADRLLQPGAMVNVVRQEQGRPESVERWTRTRALATLKEHTPLIAGPSARAGNHGVCCVLALGCWLFFETAHE